MTDVTLVILNQTAKNTALGGGPAVSTDAQKRGVIDSWELDGNVSRSGKVGLIEQKDELSVVTASTPSDNSVTHPAAATFRTVANSVPTDTLSYQWFWSNGLALVANSLMTGVTASNLVISDSTGLNGKRFFCNVTALNYGGSAQTAIANLAVA